MSGSTPPSRTVLFVGGGSGGHIYPNLAVVERLRELGVVPSETSPHLVVSRRPLDAQIAAGSGLGFTAIPAAPLSGRPAGLARFWREFRRGKAAVAELIRETDAAAMVATGGFVSGPAVAAARKAGVPVALVSLDAVPGRANRFTARHATAVFSAFPPPEDAINLPRTENIGFPLRRAAVAPPEVTPQEAREHFGLDPQRKTLLVFAGSQGARTINRAMKQMLGQPDAGKLFRGWQVLHVAGPEAGDDVPAEVPGVRVKVLPFCDRMDLAWRAASGGASGGAGLTRAGAGTVAEAWANAVPCVMLPYPYHKDEHQKHNAAPLVERGGAVVLRDLIEPVDNAVQISAVFELMLRDDEHRRRMAAALRDDPPPDGAARLAAWVRSVVETPSV